MEKTENMVNQVLYRTFLDQKSWQQAVTKACPEVTMRHDHFIYTGNGKFTKMQGVGMQENRSFSWRNI